MVPLDCMLKCENIKIWILSISATDFFFGNSHIMMILKGYRFLFEKNFLVND